MGAGIEPALCLWRTISQTTIGKAIVLLPLHWAYPHRLLLFDLQVQEVIIALTVGLVVSEAYAGAGFFSVPSKLCSLQELSGLQVCYIAWYAASENRTQSLRIIFRKALRLAFPCW